MDDLITRIKAEKWRMQLIYYPTTGKFACLLEDAEKARIGRADTPEAAIIDAIREMDSK